MEMNDRSLIDKINPIFIALTATAIHHCLSAWKIVEFRVPPEFGPGGGAQRKWDTRNINHAGNNACTDVFRRLDAEVRSFTPDVQANNMNNIRSMIRQRIHATGINPAKAHPDYNQAVLIRNSLITSRRS
jgi:hypothetical protein